MAFIKLYYIKSFLDETLIDQCQNIFSHSLVYICSWEIQFGYDGF